MKTLSRRVLAVVMSVVMAVSLMPAPAGALVSAGSAGLAGQALSVRAPRVVADSSMASGQKATWDCVWFGSYPQEVVSDPATIAALDAASWSGDRATVGGAVYARLDRAGTTYSGYFGDFSSHYGSGGRLYFKCSPIKWRVLEADGSTALLLADQALDGQRYNSTYTSVTWETCTLRSWLNSSFEDAAFTSAEKAAIRRQTLANEDNPYYGTAGGNATSDDVFLLALSDVYGDGAAAHGFASGYPTYDEGRCAHVSDFAHAMGGYRYTYHSCQPDSGWWWLRSPGSVAGYASDVRIDGNVSRNGGNVDGDLGVVRPALRISLSSNQISYAGTVCSDGTDAEVGGGNVPAPTPTPETGKKVVGPSTGAAKKLKLDNNIEIAVPEDVPLVGKQKIGLDFDAVGVEFERDGNTFKIGIGVKNLQDMDEDDWGTFKRFVEKQDESLRKGLDSLLASKFGTATMGMSVSPKVSCYGWAEGTITEAGVQSVEGKVSIEVKAKASQEWQTMVWVIPVVFTFEGSVGAKASYALGLDFDSAKAYTKGTVDLTLPKIKLTAGVGIAYVADIGVYGSAANKVKFTRRSTGKALEATLSGELGVRARALFFEYEQALLQGDWNYYSNQNLRLGALSAQPAQPTGSGSWFGIERAQAGAWRDGARMRGLSALSAGGAAGSGAAGAVTLQTDVFDGAQPALVQTSSGTCVLVFAQDAAGRATGNHTAIAYSVRKAGASSWSEPVVIDDDGTADFDPSVAVDGDDVWVAWGNAKRAFAAGEEAAEDFAATVAASCEVECAKIDLSGAGSGAGSVSTYAITDDDDFDLKPQMAIAAGAPCVAWVSNAGNDALALSGRNTVMRAALNPESGSFAAEAVRTTDLPVASLAAGQLEGGLALAFAEDSDGDLTTTADMRLYAADSKGAIAVQAEGGFAPSFARIGGGDALCWLQSGDGGVCLRSAAQAGGAAATIVPEDANLSSDYAVVSADGSDMVLCPAAKDGDADGSDVASWMVAGGTASGPVAVTDMGGYASAPCGIFADGSLELAFLRSDITISDGRVRQSADLCVASVGSRSRAAVAGVEFDEAAMVPGGRASVSVEVRNDGLADAESGSVSVSMGGAVLGTAEIGALPTGQSATAEVEVPLPAGMAAGSAMRVSAALGSSTDATEVAVGKPNLVLSASDDDGAAEVAVENDSGFSTGATLKVLAADGASELASFDLGEVAAGTAATKAFTASEVSAFGEDTLVFKAVATDEELYESDNVQALYVGGSVLATLDHLEVTVPTDSYHVGDVLDPAIATVQAVYADGTTRVLGAEDYTTNASDIDLSTIGGKTLTYTYEEVGAVRSADVPLTVSPRDISDAVVTLAAKSCTYDGKAKKPAVTVKIGGATLKAGTDYKVSYSANVNAGTAKATVKGEGNYTGAASAKFSIGKAANAVSMSTAAVVKTGSVGKATTFTRAANATSGAVKYASNSKYVTVSKAGKVTVRKNWTGTAKVTASSPASANYKAAASKSYAVKVKPGKMAVKAAANVKGAKAKVTWAKMAGADKYQVRVALDAKFTKGKKTYSASASLASKTTGKLAKGKAYYAQVRAYDKQTGSWGAWSVAKKVKIGK